MNLSRRFLNVVLEHQSYGTKSLHRVNLERQSFFNPEATTTGFKGSESAVAQGSRSQTPAADVNNKKQKTGIIRLPGPSISFSATPTSNAWRIDCLPLTENKRVFLDQSGRADLYHSDERSFVTMPSLHKPKQIPISLSIPNTREDVQRIYIMEKTPGFFPFNQFEAFIQERPRNTTAKAWQCQPLPLPPYFYEGKKESKDVKAYAVVGDGSHICFSLEGFGTYCFDTVSHAWSHLGKWTLPFYGKAEYVPELKLWFGLSAEDHLMCAAGLSNMDARPQLVNAWNELDQPEGSEMPRDSELVHLGSGRFCIARSYDAVAKFSDFVKGMFNDDVTLDDSYSGDESLIRYASHSIMTGVEVVPCGPVDKRSGNGNVSGSGNSSDGASGNGTASDNGNGNGKGLQMITHKSERYTYTAESTIASVF